MMQLSLAARTARSSLLRAFLLNLGGGPVHIEIRDGVRPAFGAAGGTLLADFTANVGNVTSSNGVLTIATPIVVTALATGVATWARLYDDGDGPAVIDCDISITGGGGELQLNTTSIVAGMSVTLTLATFTEGNA